MKITREQLRNIVGEVLQEEKDYQSFFKAMLKKHGVSSPDEFKSDEEKKAFFNKVEDTWKGVSERLVQLKEDELTAKQQKIDLNKNGKVDGDDLSKLRAGAKTEAELSAAQQKIDLNKNGKVDGDDLSKLRAGAKTEGEETTSLTKILSKEGETLVKSGAGKMYNITKVNESKESDILAKIEKLRLDAEAGKIKTLDQFLDKFKPLQKQLKALGESVNEGIWPKSKLSDRFEFELDAELKKNFKGIFYVVGHDLYHNDKKVLTIDGDKDSINVIVKKLKSTIKESVNEAGVPAIIKGMNPKLLKVGEKITINTNGKKTEYKVVKYNSNGDCVLHPVNEIVNEGKYDADLDKIEAVVKNATSFMNVGSELKKAGIKYDFTTSMIPMYMIKVSGNTIAIVNKKYAAGAEKTVGDIAIGLLEGNMSELTFKSADAAAAYKAKHKLRPGTKMTISGIKMPNGYSKK